MNYLKILLLSGMAISSCRSVIICQDGFSDTLLISNSYNINIDDIIYHDNQLLIQGNSYNKLINKWCQFVAALDTFGTILWSKEFCDTSNYLNLVTNTPSRFIYVKELKKIILPTYYFETNEVGIYLLNSLGEIEFIHKYNNTEKTVYPRDVIYYQNYFYLFGTIQKQNFFEDCYVMKLDTLGNRLWIKYYGTSNYDNDFNDVFLNQNGTFSITSREYLTDLFILEDPDAWIRPWIFTIDTEGNIITQWKGEKNDERTRGWGPFYHLSNGDWIICSFEVKDTVINYGTFWKKAPTITRMNSNFELIWKHYLGNFTGFWDSFLDLEYDSIRGEFLAAGHRVYWYSETYSELHPWAVKFTQGGAILWSISDTILSDSLNGVMHFTAGMDLSASGSAYLAGYVEHSISPKRQYGWIMKVTQDGCLDTACVWVSDHSTLPVLKEFLFYPNPAHNFFYIDVPQSFGISDAIIYGLDGRLYQKNKCVPGENIIQIQLAPGNYFIRLSSEKGQFFSKRLIVI